MTTRTESIHESAVKQYKETGTPVEVTESFLDLFVPEEGELSLIYGKIGQGKTYLATEQVINDLKNGQIVYTSWPIFWDGFDERQSLLHTFGNLLFPWRKRFYVFPKENWHFLDCFDPNVWDKLETLTDCKIYFDDVIVRLFDSYEKTHFSKKKREWAFFTRHFDRSIILVTQRANQVQVALRSQVNRFFKCHKVFNVLGILLFRRTEYQDMKNDMPDEEQKPDSVKYVLGKKRVFNSYNSKYLRHGMEASQKLHVLAYDLSLIEKIKALALVLRNTLPLKRKRVSARKKNSVIEVKTLGVKYESVETSIKFNVSPYVRRDIPLGMAQHGTLTENLPLELF